ncbi:tape measure protein [Microbacterium sp. CBA3102]|uniref:tape measure protein n=1 Tax=Microbacterium sp. CBA3102 TaxID=2603598 RepID=UPI0011BB3A02|nr:tape measure protein [Microbacterium sp. CBA3102]QEA30389.1 tape measure protein [Microbacterium sp. CBA3102]
MAQEIGVAYVSLLPSGKGFSRAVQGEAESAFKGAEKSSNGFFSGVTKWAKRGALVVGGMVATVGALAVGGGISRALNIEDATAKLKGLGHDTKAVEAIMKDALASVKGTAFGLDAAATTAASAVAAGIKPGQELERYLRLTADAATIAGTSMEEMGSIINQVTSKGYAGMENLNRLTERGIPIMQWLQEEYGVTADELQKMVSRGEVDAATFRKAIAENIGGAALESGNTTRGAFANMRAALSRLGLAFVGDGLSGAKTFFNEITIILDGLEERIGPFVQRIQDKFGGLFQIDGFGEKFLAGLDTFTANFSSTPFGALLEALKPLVPVIREIGTKVGPALADALRQIFEAVAPLLPLVGEALVDAIVELAPPLTDLIVALLPLIPPLVSLVQVLLPPLADLLTLLVPIVAAVAEGLATFLEAAMILSDWYYGDTTFSDMLEQIGALTGPIGDLVQSVVAMHLQISNVLNNLGAFWQSKWFEITGAVTGAARNIGSAAAGLWSTLSSLFSSGVSRVISIFSNLPRSIQALFAGVGSWLVNSGRALMQGFINGITSMIGSVGDAIGGVLDWAAGFFPHSPALRGPFSGAGWVSVADGGASLMEQFSTGAENYRPQFSFQGLTNLAGAASVRTGDTYVQNPFTGGYLLAVMDERAAVQAAERGGAVSTALRGRRRADG